MDAGTSETRLGPPPAGRPGDGFTPGTLLAGRYRIVALAGRGGMGEVYRADDLRLGQAVALKFLPPALEQNAAARERLVAEVRNARIVAHPNVCRVWDVIEAEGRYFLTMEYIDGEDLASLLRRIGRLQAGKALEVARQLAAGLAAAHDRGVLHRDLKPANVMIDGRGQVRITDFGLAVARCLPGVALQGAGGAGAAAAETDACAGTLGYMAPERFEGRPATVQSDLYALGLILYETYTGKAAVAPKVVRTAPVPADGFLDWQHAHHESTPTDPSVHAPDMDAAVERAILRCLAKDPARRPSSAAQLLMALPGGDPLAAALAAGETPSPELVAASGEEGTLPRARAWRWLLGCLVALALSVPLGSRWHLENLVPLDPPVVQKARARQILERLGYSETPADSALWVQVNRDYMWSVMARQRPRQWFALADSFMGPLGFAYRQSSAPLFVWNPFGRVEATQPVPVVDDEIYMEMGPRGRLLWLRVGGIAPRWEPSPFSPGAREWPALLFDAAGLDPGAFTSVEPLWPPTFAFDERAAWQGPAGNEIVRVEAAAWRGRPVEVRIRPASLTPAGSLVERSSWLEWLLDLFIAALSLGAILALAIVARHNVRAGRGDRKGALKTALVVFVAEAAFLVFHRHWTFEPLNIVRVPSVMLGVAFYTALVAWLFYLGLEPFLRRHWPHLLVAWTRLLDGRWRDPMVGRSLLAGTTAALVTIGVLPGLAALATETADLPLAFPWAHTQLHAGLGWVLANSTMFMVGPAQALFMVGVLVMARLFTRSDPVAWLLVAMTNLGVWLWVQSLGQPWVLASPLALLPLALLIAVGGTLVLARHGVLSFAVFLTVGTPLLNAPITWDVSKWYFWRTAVVVVLLAGVALWGFRNVLGRQTAFSAGALDE